jgi:DNA modification methylase
MKVEKEFVSELEKIQRATELNFDPTPGFGKFKNLMPKEAIAHPAKANVFLVEYLILKHTKEGETILDPMAGTGVLGVIASIHGRNAIQVELETKFYDWMEKARENVEKHTILTPKGKIVNICGDARRLSELVNQADVVVTSPPYTNSAAENPNVWKYRKGGKFAEEKVDTIITSPPHGDTYLGGGDVEKRKERLVKAGYDPKEFLGGKARNAVLKHYDEVDAVITSPPFGEPLQYRGGTQNKERMMKGNRPSPYSTNKENIGNLPIGNLSHNDIDAIITSPPYENQLHDSAEKRAAGAWNGSELDVKKNLPVGYSENPENIGNLKRETYLSEMLKVYSECYKVLRPNGKAIIVIKPFIRNKRVVDLPYHTYLLMKRIGFELEKLYKLRLKTSSFWRILYHKKFSNVPKIAHEWILVMRKVGI